jgi:two-component system, NtrC family, response regulator HydG
MRSRILVISGDRDDALHLSRMLHGLHVQVNHADSVRQARTQLGRRPFNAILTDAALPDGSWQDILTETSGTRTQVIVTDRQADARLWAEALNLGAYDLLPQPFYEPEVRRIFHNVCSPPALTRAAV